MTAKRFKKDRGTFWNNDKRLNMEETVEILNALHEENEQLRKDVARYRGNFREMEDVKCELAEENEQLKEQLSEAKADEEQLGISFMGYKMKLIEVLQKKYDKVKGKPLYADVYTEIAEEMGVDLE